MTGQPLATATDAIIPVILSGGSGTRLWPVSRESFPKQLWPLVSEPHHAAGDGAARRRAGLRAADRRLQPGAPVPDRRADARRRASRTRRSCSSRSGRNSAPAITAAALLVAEPDPDAVLWMMAADAAIQRKPMRCTRRSTRAVVGGAGRADRHLRHAAAPGRDGLRLYRGRAPSCRKRRACTRWRASSRSRMRRRRPSWPRRGRHLWNSGMFVFTAAHAAGGDGSVYAPEVLAAVQAGGRRAHAGPRLRPARPGGVRRLPEHQPRLRGRRAHDAGGRGAGRSRLVRRRQLGRAVGAAAEGRRRQRRGGRRAAGGLQRTASSAATAS